MGFEVERHDSHEPGRAYTDAHEHIAPTRKQLRALKKTLVVPGVRCGKRFGLTVGRDPQQRSFRHEEDVAIARPMLESEARPAR